jgi:transaldolase
MELWLDSADLKEISEAKDWGFIKGATTNPSLALRAKVGNYKEQYFFIAKALNPYPVSYQLTKLPPDYFLWEAVLEGHDVYEEGNRILVERHKAINNVVIKVPVMSENYWCRVIRDLRRANIPVNTTLVFSCEQALMAAEVGANYVSVFVGRIEDFEKTKLGLTREDPTPVSATSTVKKLLADIQRILQKNHYPTKLLVASIRTKQHVRMAAELGAPIVTVPFKVLEEMSRDERGLSENGYKLFRQDAIKIGTAKPREETKQDTP